MNDWKPTATIDCLRERGEFLAKVRRFFAQRDVLEVETPLLARYTVSDPHIDAIRVAEPEAWLQTSPEFAMKRLLAAGSGDIYQICKAFRRGESGRLHNPEFTLLEWYRVGFSLQQLMAEVEDLLGELLGADDAARYSYAEVFKKYLSIDPHEADRTDLKSLALDFATSETCQQLDSNGLLDLLFSHAVQPQLQALSFVYDYPASQAALAVTASDSQGRHVAQRLECFYQGLELGNAYQELLDPDEFMRRHQSDNAIRQHMDKQAVDLDTQFYAAMSHGLPACSGIAIGLDRVFMLDTGADSIDQVISFRAS